jgi:hypothetical protein
MDLSCQWKEHWNPMSVRVMVSLCIIECANKRMLWCDVNMCSSVWVGLYKPNQRNAGNVIHKLDSHCHFQSFSSPVLVVQHAYTFAEQRENRPKSPNIEPSLMSGSNESQVIHFLKMNGFHNHFAHLHGHLQMCSIKSTILEKGPMTIRCDPQSYFFPTHTSLSKNLQQIGLRDSSSAKNLTIPIWNLSISL